MTAVNIKKAWAAAGLLPFRPELILQQFPTTQLPQQYNIEIRPTTPPEATITSTGPNGNFHLALTPANALHIQKILHQVTQTGVETQQPDLSHILQKVGKAAIRAMAESTIQGVTNAELIQLNKRKEQKSNRPKGNYGTARFMNEAVLKERQTNQANKAWKAVVTTLNRLGPDIFKPKEKPGPKSRPTPRKKLSPPVIRPAVVTPFRSPIAASATAIPCGTRVPPAIQEETPSKGDYTIARITTKGNRTIAYRTTKRLKRLIIRLPIRVTTAELEWGLRGQNSQEGQEGQEGHVIRGISQSGRGMRTRKPRKA